MVLDQPAFDPSSDVIRCELAGPAPLSSSSGTDALQSSLSSSSLRSRSHSPTVRALIIFFVHWLLVHFEWTSSFRYPRTSALRSRSSIGCFVSCHLGTFERLTVCRVFVPRHTFPTQEFCCPSPSPSCLGLLHFSSADSSIHEQQTLFHDAIAVHDPFGPSWLCAISKRSYRHVFVCHACSCPNHSVRHLRIVRTRHVHQVHCSKWSVSRPSFHCVLVSNFLGPIKMLPLDVLFLVDDTWHGCSCPTASSDSLNSQKKLLSRNVVSPGTG